MRQRVSGGVVIAAVVAAWISLGQPINSCNVCDQIYPAWVCAVLCGW